MTKTNDERAHAMRLVHPSTVQADLTRRLEQRFGLWLLQSAVTPQDCDSSLDATQAQGTERPGSINSEADIWPMRVVLGTLTEREVLQEMGAVDRWAREWLQAQATLPNGITLFWETRAWARLGEQRLPVRLVIDSPLSLAIWLKQGRRWQQATVRRNAMLERFPGLRHSTVCRKHLSVFTDWEDRDVSRLHALLGWFEIFPQSELYLRQLPVPDLDTKWVGTRKGVVRDFVLAAQGKPLAAEAQDFHAVCGLRKPAAKLRMRILCPRLRTMVAGLCDIEAPVEEIAAMNLPVRSVLIVENLETGLALPDFDATVAFMRLGHAVSELARVPWLAPYPVAPATQEKGLPQLIYWGDLDTHGFAILSRARGIFARLQSILMDEATFLEGQALWVTEPTPNREEEPRHLSPEEAEVYAGLRTHRWGNSLRLEQERLPWQRCLSALRERLNEVTASES